jgi:hypothetical protein
MGLKESAAALGGVSGPLLAALLVMVLAPREIFGLAATLPVLAALLAAGLLRGARGRRKEPLWESSGALDQRG